MLDTKFLINNKDIYEKNMTRRNLSSDYETFYNLYTSHKVISEKIQLLRENKNKTIGFSQDAKKIKKDIADLVQKERILNHNLHNWLSYQPNIILNEVPDGYTENNHQVVYTSSIPHFQSKPHYDLIDNLILKEEATHLSGSRFVVFKNDLSNLKRALTSFLLEHNQSFGYETYEVPYIVNSEIVFATGQLPKFAEDAFQLTNNQWLISTGETSLVNLFANKIFNESDLPKLSTTFSPCFRSEAGSASRDTKGLIRLHQFHKVELVSICRPEDAEFYHQKQLNTAKAALDKLNLPYRVLLICAGDMGFTASKQYDIEVWLPGSNRFLEIASCSQCGTFQAMRANIKYKKDSKNFYVHTLNGSSLPIERLIAAIIENYYDEDSNSFKVPDALIPYLKKDSIKL